MPFTSCVNNENTPCLREDRCMGKICSWLHIEGDELLTVAEREVVWQLGDVWGRMSKIIGFGPDASGDRAEAINHIHNLQRMVMSQAAARRYPELFRPLGGL